MSEKYLKREDIDGLLSIMTTCTTIMQSEEEGAKEDLAELLAKMKNGEIQLTIPELVETVENIRSEYIGNQR